MATLPPEAILIVSALTEEIQPLTGRLRRGRRGRVAGRRVWSGEIAGRDVVVAAAGEGEQLAARGVEALLDATEPRALLGIGLAGGLTSDLEVGDLVWSREVRTETGRRWQPPRWRWSDRAERTLGVRGGSVLGMPQIVADSAAKRELARRLAPEYPAVVDLESPVWAGAADRRGLPWLILRSVSDPVGESLPLDFSKFSTRDGRVSRTRVAAHAVGRPVLWKSLKQLQSRMNACAVALADATEGLLAW